MKHKYYFLLMLLSLITLNCSKKDSNPVDNNQNPTNNSNVWTVYNTSNSPIYRNQVDVVVADNSNNLWLGFSTGLCKYDGSNWTKYDNTNSVLLNSSVGAIYSISDAVWIGIDSKWDGTKYINGGMAKYQGGNLSYYKFQQNIGTNPAYVTAICSDANNILYVGTSEGLVIINSNNWKILNKSNSSIPFESINSLKIDNSNNLWVGTWGGGLLKYNLTNQTWTQYNSTNSAIGTDRAEVIFIEQNIVWVCKDDGTGITKFDGSSWTPYTTSNGLPSNYVTSVLKNSNEYWFATGDGGIAKSSNGQWTIYNILNSATPSNKIIDFCLFQSSYLALATDDAGIVLFKIK